MAYGLLAGTEPVNGLYCDLVGPWAYGIFGSSPQISVGTFSIIAIMSSIALSKFDDRCVNYDCVVRTNDTAGIVRGEFGGGWCTSVK